MDYKRRIDEIVARAERLHLAIGGVAEAGGVSKSTLYRWRQADANPRIRTMLRALDAMEAQIESHEKKIVAELTAEAQP